ncbi:MAG: DUF3800 domain-containing protein [Gammaproteobacteria bacterium]|jgi:hypothetical protein
MRIYIDESGIFKPEEKTSSISCVAALMIPDNLEPALFREFEKWKMLPSLQKKKNASGEIKGSKLDEKDVSSLLLLLSKFDVIVEVSCLELGRTTNLEIERYKKKLADSFSSSQIGTITNEKFDKNVLVSLSNPLFSQNYVLYEVINSSLNVAIPYYAQRIPATIGSFEWFIDAKNKNITEYEKILIQIIRPFLQEANSRNPWMMVEGEDYSGLTDFIIPHENLLEPLKQKVAGTQTVIFSIDKILEKISFEQSHANCGIQIVDIIVNCIRRAMRGNLKFNGWKYFSNLIIYRKKEQAVKIIKYHSRDIETLDSCAKFVNYFKSYGKQMLVPDEIKPKILTTGKGYIKWCYLDKLSGGYRITQEYY